MKNKKAWLRQDYKSWANIGLQPIMLTKSVNIT